jgi:hypothetical protein
MLVHDADRVLADITLNRPAKRSRASSSVELAGGMPAPPPIPMLAMFCYWLVYSQKHVRHRLPQGGGFQEREHIWQALDAPPLVSVIQPGCTQAPPAEPVFAEACMESASCFRPANMRGFELQTCLDGMADAVDAQLVSLFRSRGWGRERALDCMKWLQGTDEWSAFGAARIFIDNGLLVRQLQGHQDAELWD